MSVIGEKLENKAGSSTTRLKDAMPEALRELRPRLALVKDPEARVLIGEIFEILSLLAGAGYDTQASAHSAAISAEERSRYRY